MKHIGIYLLGFFIIGITQFGCNTYDRNNQNDQHDQNSHYDYSFKKEMERMQWQLPERVMNEIGVKKGMSVADIGAGTGFFTIRLAKRVGSNGIIYANEISQVYIDIIQKRCSEEGLDNVKTIIGSQMNPLLPENTFGIVLVVNVFHFLEDPVAYFSNVKCCLNETGRLVIIQWDSDKMKIEVPDMPEEEVVKYSKERILESIDEAGYLVERVEDFLPQQSIYICTDSSTSQPDNSNK